MSKANPSLIHASILLLMAVLAALAMQWVTPAGGTVGVALWAAFFLTILYFPPSHCVARIRRVWKRN